jgi:hypothetical protein
MYNFPVSSFVALRWMLITVWDSAGRIGGGLTQDIKTSVNTDTTMESGIKFFIFPRTDKFFFKQAIMFSFTLAKVYHYAFVVIKANIYLPMATWIPPHFKFL